MTCRCGKPGCADNYIGGPHDTPMPDATTRETANIGAGSPPLDKASIIDKHADEVRDDLRNWTYSAHAWREVLAVARARHILGSYEYGDTNLFEWTDGKVRAAIIEELADAVVYQAWLLEREEQRG